MRARRNVMRASLKWPDACFVMPWGMVSTLSMCLLIVGLHANRSFRQSASYVAVQCTIIGLAKMNPKLRYQTSKSKRPQNIHELIVRYERTTSCYCRKYKCKYIQLHAKLGEQPVRIFIIKYGRSTHWKVLLTTDTSMNFVRAFELYERRWGIEVIFKECRGYLGLGKCQSRSYNAQIADTTLCFMMYQMLSLAKRFSEYETLGALFRSERDRLQVLTLWSRTLEEVRHLLEVLSREAGVDLLTCLSTVAARQTADFSTKVWAHLLCDSDDYAMPDLN